jgi:hypothetical protein
VVHFVAQGAIEEGMLSVLAFKKSMFAGVLDGGKDEVFLGGTRLKRFMESVEKVTSAIPAASLAEPESAPAAEAGGPAGPGIVEELEQFAEPRGAAAAPPEQQAWNDVLSAGATLLEKLGQALDRGGRDSSGKSADTPLGPLAGLVSRDERTGQSYVKLPLPEQDVIHKIVSALSSLAGRG